MTAPGVTFLDHTADVGMDVAAPTFGALLERAAAGMLALLRGEEDAAPGADRGPIPGRPGAGPSPGGAGATPESIAVELHADGPARLLADWLRELLFLHEVRGLDCDGVRFGRLTERELAATVALVPAPPPAREIKGVTHHELTARRTATGWRARVIFDV